MKFVLTTPEYTIPNKCDLGVFVAAVLMGVIPYSIDDEGTFVTLTLYFKIMSIFAVASSSFVVPYSFVVADFDSIETYVW